MKQMLSVTLRLVGPAMKTSSLLKNSEKDELLRNFRMQGAAATNLSCALGLNFESKLRSGPPQKRFSADC